MPKSFFDKGENMLETPELKTEDFSQRELLDPIALCCFESVKEIEDLVETLKNNVQLIRRDAMDSGLMYGCIHTLMLMQFSENEIVKWGKLFFVKKVTDSIPIIQVHLRDLQNIPALPNNKKVLKATQIIEKILIELISEFGEE